MGLASFNRARRLKEELENSKIVLNKNEAEYDSNLLKQEKELENLNTKKKKLQNKVGD